ncbi:MAG: phosphatidate cytidylyltransferase, partial [Chloroflexota bacterium]
MKARILSALVLAPVMIALVLLGGVWYMAGICVACAIGVWEAFPLIAKIGEAPGGFWWRYAAAGSGAALLIGIQAGFDHPHATQVIWAGALVGSLLLLLCDGQPARHFMLWAAVVAAVLYVAG